MMADYQRNLRKLAIPLTYLLVFQLTQASGLAQTQPPPRLLNIVVVEGEGAITNIRRPVSKEPLIRVEDENQKPVVGAAVVFTLPTEGPSGEFLNHSKTLTILTDARGEAQAKGLHTNGLPGKVPIHIVASYRGATGRANMMQFSVAPAGSHVSADSGEGHHGKLVVALLIIGGAAGGGAAYALSRKSGSSSAGGAPTGPSAPAAIGITAGTGTIALPPH